ncbi:MAG: hypothetical protein ACRCTG_14610 [Aestuariivirga sp.]
MTAEIISLADARKPMADEPEAAVPVWRCGCGCATHFARADGQIECANCAAMASGNSGEWRGRVPDPEMQVVPPMEDSSLVVTDLMSGEAACRRVLSADPKDLAAAIIFTKDGRVRVWGLDFSGDEQLAWLDRRLAEARRLLVKAEGDDGA